LRDARERKRYALSERGRRKGKKKGGMKGRRRRERKEGEGDGNLEAPRRDDGEGLLLGFWAEISERVLESIGIFYELEKGREKFVIPEYAIV
jgi:hypothetical protein